MQNTSEHMVGEKLNEDFPHLITCLVLSAHSPFCVWSVSYLSPSLPIPPLVSPLTCCPF